jgi:hypothetical protein
VHHAHAPSTHALHTLPLPALAPPPAANLELVDLVAAVELRCAGAVCTPVVGQAKNTKRVLRHPLTCTAMPALRQAIEGVSAAAGRVAAKGVTGRVAAAEGVTAGIFGAAATCRRRAQSTNSFIVAFMLCSGREVWCTVSGREIGRS